MPTHTHPLDNIGAKRLISLDAFRGFTIAGMVIVNDPGSWEHVYPPLRHAEWHGITPTDLVFPFFVYIVGVSVAIAYNKRLKANVPKNKMILKIIKRTLIIFALGVFLNSIHLIPEFNFSELRIVGVLQRIAIVFFACALLFLYTDWKAQLRIGIITLIAYWLLMKLVPVPGVGIGLLDPGQNFAAYIDSFLVPGRMYQGTWDPEGVFSTFPAIVTGISGMLAGKLILSDLRQGKKLIWLFALGFLAYVLACVWDWFFPINKNLWTSSYVLYTSGLASMSLAASIWFVDILGYQKWTKIGIVYGANALAAYVLHGVLARFFFIPIGGTSINSFFMNGMAGIGFAPKFASMLWAVGYMLFIYLIAYILYKRKIFIKI
ncbi:MAG: DUF5009 domain-containing protein [Bacteroidetes bacterium]|nr:DUF5009 domain-containing protein [Bacteroidota bacterium]